MRKNNINLFRLLFASMVVLSHSPELIDGNRSREILTNIFGTLSFGELGVDGFFIVSGYLVTQSFVNSSSSLNYLVKRIARIYPAFIVATLITYFVFGPIAQSPLDKLTAHDWTIVSYYTLLLSQPIVPGFVGLPHPLLNGAMWTIAFEFRCYLLILILGLLGVLRMRFLVLFVALLLLAMSALRIYPAVAYHPEIFGVPSLNIRFFGIFLAGASFYLFRDVIPYSASIAIAMLVALTGAMFIPFLAEAAVATLGGYLIFFAAFHLPTSRLAEMAIRYDVSYGLYLIAWPVQNSFIMYFPGISPWVLFVVSLTIATLYGFLSWILIEAPILNNVRRPAPLREFESQESGLQ
jgi:peptidoglycan/LPS O-acetylase OafA/YrhL